MYAMQIKFSSVIQLASPQNELVTKLHTTHA